MVEYKKIKLEDIEEILCKLPDVLKYPINHGNGVYEVSKGVFGNKQLSDQIDEEFMKLIRE